MHSEIKTFFYPNGEYQRVQWGRLDSWDSLEFLDLKGSSRALDCFAEIYRKHLIPACPWIFGNLVLFTLPEDVHIPFSRKTGKDGTVADDLTAAAAALQAGVFFSGRRPIFRNREAEQFYRELERRGCVRIVRGKLPTTRFLPVSNCAGFLTEEAKSPLKVNASFFIMDPFDCASVYDHIGTPFGLCVKDGNILRPPLFHREAMLVKKDGSICIRPVDIRHLGIRINGKEYRHGENAVIYSRPDRNRTPFIGRTALVITGRSVSAVCADQRIRIPASGFVLQIADGDGIKPGDTVTYCGLEDTTFGIQVGNSIVIDGEKTRSFRSKFYNIRHLQPVPFPPSLYPPDFRKARAARIALGADQDGYPMVLWAEGAPKQGYKPGKDSCGASLSEMADICSDVGMVNAVNLDGGGSAQILLNHQRSLLISDRKGMEETERPVPLGLMVK